MTTAELRQDDPADLLAAHRQGLATAPRRTRGSLVKYGLPSGPELVRPAIASPRHWFSWFVWSSEPRAPTQDPFLRFAGHASERCRG